MNEWNVVTVIIALVGLFATVTKPILKLNSTMSSLDKNMAVMNEKVEGLEERVNDLEDSKSKKHKEIWDKQHDQDKILQNHERRLHDIDGKWFDGGKE